MTKEQQDRYLAGFGVHCPFCESEDIEGGFVTVDSGGAHQTVTCHACDRQWVDVYTLTAVEEVA